MTADGSTDQVRAVRDQLRLGRLLPLGGATDGAWIAESAAADVLRSAATEVTGVRIDSLRLALADPEAPDEPAVPAPPSALPPGPLRIDAEFATTATAPLHERAERVRTALATAAVERLGLLLASVDLRVTDLLDEAPAPAAGPPAGALPPTCLVPGVADVRALHEEQRAQGPHVRVEIEVARDHRTLDAAQAARTALLSGRADRPTVAVVVTEVR